MNLTKEQIYQFFAILFTSHEVIHEHKIAEFFPEVKDDILHVISQLKEYLHHSTPLTLKKVAGGYKLCTRPEYSKWIAEKLPAKKQKLSKALLEVLSIIAYYQPVTSQNIEELRGSPADYGIQQLIEKNYIYVVGKKDSLGKPNLYATTEHFLKVFGLNSIENLPSSNQLSSLQKKTSMLDK